MTVHFSNVFFRHRIYGATAVIPVFFLSSTSVFLFFCLLLETSIFASVFLSVFLSVLGVLIERIIRTVTFGHGNKFLSSVHIISKL